MDFGANKTHVAIIKVGDLEELILETFVLVLMVNGIESHGNNLMNQKMLIKSIIA